ncbi:MAG: hypothetical protein K5875_06275 [Saccharofermentans sp.]|nr:hypothetical protein [Saccharofermentans sp.]
MKKRFLCVCCILMVLIQSSCSNPSAKIKYGVYRSETSDAYIEVYEDSTVYINYDLSVFEKILEDETIEYADFSENEAQIIRENFNLNRDFANKKVKYELDDGWYKYEGYISFLFYLNNPYEEGVVSWGLAYYPASEKIILEADSTVSDDHVSEIFVLEK